MSDAFGIVEPLVSSRLGIELVDARTLSNEEQHVVRELWHEPMKALLRADPNFVPKETCTNQQACLGPLLNEYVDHTEDARARGLEPQTFEVFEEANHARLLPDFISKSYLPLHWFGLRPIGQRTFTGALCISNIETVKHDGSLNTLCGWPVAVHPAIGLVDVATVNGAICRLVMDTDLVTVDPREANVDFVQWVLPQHPDARYIARGANTYGRDVFEEMADRVRVKLDPVDGAPIEIKRELQPEDDAAEFPDYTRPTRAAAVESVSPLGASQPSSRG